MENTKLVFIGEQEEELLLYANDSNKIFICIEMGDFPSRFITLNKATAIKLAKELRKQISYLEEEF